MYGSWPRPRGRPQHNKEIAINHSANSFSTCGYCLPRTTAPAAEIKIITNNNNKAISSEGSGSFSMFGEGRTRPLLLLKLAWRYCSSGDCFEER